MATLPESSDPEILEATTDWLERAVIGLNLCPFARSVHVKKQIRYVVSPHADTEALLTQLIDEMNLLAETDAAAMDTTLLICPHTLSDFGAFNDFLILADMTLASLRLRGTLQIASFHPQYRFEGMAPDAIENYTNRAPYPILHLLREASISRAVASIPDAAEIYERNEATLRKLGSDGWAALWKKD